jgi:nucleoside-diphosphate-sugar epimerase
MRIAVTGASGFIGGAIASFLVGRDHHVYSYGRRPQADVYRALPDYTQWDIRAPLQNPADVDAVVHCAALVGDWGDDAEYQRVNVQGTAMVLDTFHAASRFVYISSASVYSPGQHDRKLQESASTGEGLLTAYARSKAAAEKVILSRRPDAIILRPHIVYGPGDTTLMPRVIAARILGRLLIPGNGTNAVSPTHVSNLTHAVECALCSVSATGVFNICDSAPVQVDSLLGVLLRREGYPTRLIHVPRGIAWNLAVAAERTWRALGIKRAPRLTRYLVQQVADGHTLDISRAIDFLGYDPRYDCRSGASNIAES